MNNYLFRGFEVTHDSFVLVPGAKLRVTADSLDVLFEGSKNIENAMINIRLMSNLNSQSHENYFVVVKFQICDG